MSGAPPLSEERLSALLRDVPFVARLIVMERVDSTNAELRRQALDGAPAGTLVLAETQLAGRGRRGRSWHSPAGCGLYLSVLLRPSGPAEQVTRWTLAAAVAACEACRTAGAIAVEIEWPNDLVWRGRKLGGVLAELRSGPDGGGDLVVGIGLNVSQGPADFPGELSSSATSLRLAAAGFAPDREALAVACVRGIAALSALLDAGNWSAVVSRWERLAPGARGRRVRVRPGGGDGEAYEGRTGGLDEHGGLIVLADTGRIESVRLAGSVQSLEDG